MIADSRYGQFDDYIQGVAKTFSVPFVEFRTLPYEFDDSRFYIQDHMTGDDAAEVCPWSLNAVLASGKRSSQATISNQSRS
ncbi:hypothetical protein [Bradyrhizobium sp. AS23.2]|uniref:hypothetical protein n=1 Tax=Bradyrhizobium sp. AS23.2 TaxID=1680155 RepID=UPI0011611A7A|nr:hypothetical protein [Bradyrhizobium sp. AS23.2]